MKTIASILMISSLIIGSSSAALANNVCLSEAKIQARLFSARENSVSIKTIQVQNWFFHGEEGGSLYYGIFLDNRDKVNVGLSKKDCQVTEINFVTDGT